MVEAAIVVRRSDPLPSCRSFSPCECHQQVPGLPGCGMPTWMCRAIAGPCAALLATWIGTTAIPGFDGDDVRSAGQPGTV